MVKIRLFLCLFRDRLFCLLQVAEIVPCRLGRAETRAGVQDVLNYRGDGISGAFPGSLAAFKGCVRRDGVVSALPINNCTCLF
jgi:hypothetical protein